MQRQIVLCFLIFCVLVAGQYAMQNEEGQHFFGLRDAAESNNCSEFKDCFSCTSVKMTRDYFCVWCDGSNKCVPDIRCQRAFLDPEECEGLMQDKKTCVGGVCKD